MKMFTEMKTTPEGRLPHLLDWLAEASPDIAPAPMELKFEDHNFPVAELAAAGYHAAYAGQKPTTASPCSHGSPSRMSAMATRTLRMNKSA